MHWKEKIARDFGQLDEEQRSIYRYAQEKLTKLINPKENEAILDPALKTVEGWETWLHLASYMAAKYRIYEDAI